MARVDHSSGLWTGRTALPDSSRFSFTPADRFAWQHTEPPSSIRGGLPPQVARRIREYINARTSENITLEAMADLAGLSVFHFARAFRQSFGVPPHSYLLHRRIVRAQRLLQQTELPVSEIAVSTGFSDQSHFARHFRRLTGMAPGQARWNRR
jgi:AraC-like DNA-binding protein